MTAVTGSFTGTGQSAPISPSPCFSNVHAGLSYFNLTLSGAFTATIKLERSFDGGSTWNVLSKDLEGAEAAFTAPCSLVVREPEAMVIYRLNCTSYGAGPVGYRLSI